MNNYFPFSIGDVVMVKHKYKTNTYRHGFIQSIDKVGLHAYYYIYFFDNQKTEIKGYYDLKAANSVS